MYSKDMRLLFQTYPPLGQVTVIEDKHVFLTAVLEISGSHKAGAWEVSAWHSADGSGWTETRLNPLLPSSEPQCLHPAPGSRTRRYFGASFLCDESFRFTVKARLAAGSEWLWAHDQHGLDDGVIVKQASAPSSENLEDFIKGIDTSWNIKTHMSQTPRTLLWSLEASVPLPTYDQNDNEEAGQKTIQIGLPKQQVLRSFALVRHSSAWLGPRQSKGRLFLDKEAIICSYLTQNGRYLTFLALSGIDDVLSVLRTSAEGHLVIYATSDAQNIKDSKSRVLVAESDDFGCSVAAAMYHARSLVWNGLKHAHSSSTVPRSSQDDPMLYLEKQKWYDGLGFCTWNSLGQDLTADKLHAALNSLKENNINISNLIMDDGWQSIDRRGKPQFDRGWTDFEADPESFPGGLRGLVSKIRQDHPQIQHVAVWHALLGYWGGIAPHGSLAKTYQTTNIPRHDAGMSLDGDMTVIADEDVSKLYNDFYSFLDTSGIDAVKTDVQFMVDTWSSPKARRKLRYKYLDAWSNAAREHFGMRAISCMSLFPQWIFHSQAHSDRPVYPLRSSDDYFPHEPDSHAWHLWSNAHNCILLQFLNVLPDWDMFQTAHEWAGFHAAARCISGGPIYITDTPGDHDQGIVRQVSGRKTSGKTIIFRPSVIGKAVSPFSRFEDNTLLKVGGYHGASETGTPIIGLFNVCKYPLTELIPLSIFPGIIPSTLYVVRAHTTGLVATPTEFRSSNSLFNIFLDTGGYELLSAFPIQPLPREDGEPVAVATMGLIDKMTGCAAIASSTAKRQDNGRFFISARLKALGTLGVYISCLPELLLEEDFMVTLRDQTVPFHLIQVADADKHVLTIDIEQAWEDMGLQSDWTDEVEIKISFAA